MSGITLLSVNDSKEFKKWNALSLPSVYRQEYVCAKFFDLKWSINYYIFTAFRPKWRQLNHFNRKDTTVYLDEHALMAGPKTNCMMSLVFITDLRVVCCFKNVRTYSCWIIRVTFVLGLRTDTLFTDGKVIEKSTYKHMERKRGNVVSMLERIQRNHQKQLFREASVSLQSQAAYELAEQGKNSACATVLLW